MIIKWSKYARFEKKFFLLLVTDIWNSPTNNQPCKFNKQILTNLTKNKFVNYLYVSPALGQVFLALSHSTRPRKTQVLSWMVPLYSCLTYRGTVLGPTDVRQRTTKVMDMRKHTVKPWLLMFIVRFLYIFHLHGMLNSRVIMCLSISFFLKKSLFYKVRCIIQNSTQIL